VTIDVWCVILIALWVAMLALTGVSKKKPCFEGDKMTALQELNQRWPWTANLTGEALDEAIAAHWDEMDPTEVAHMFKRLALHAAAAEAK
jgi:hypothetical protein